MPLADMPVEQLKTYQGSSPCPTDFDEYWERALEELNKIDPSPEFTPYPFASKIADCFELRFRSSRGAVIYAKFARPKNAQGKLPAVLHFHGLGGSGESWRTLISYASQGFCIATMDVRGQGGESEDAGGYKGTTQCAPFIRGIEGDPNDLFYRDIFLDTAMLYRVIASREDVDPHRVGVFGGSQGGALSIVCAALVPEIKLCAPMYPYLSDYRRVWNMDLAKGAYDSITYYFRQRDPRHEREEELFYKLGYIDIQNLAKRIRAKVLMQTGLMDTICPPSTQFAAYNKITSEKNVIFYPDYGHEPLKGGDDIVFEFLSAL